MDKMPKVERLCGEHMDRFGLISESIITDEIGIHSGVCGDYRLKTLYRPVFRRCRDQLVPVGVTSSWQPMRAGQFVDRKFFFDAVSNMETGDVSQLCAALAVYNFENIGVETLDLDIDFEVPDWNNCVYFASALGTMLEWLDMADVDRSQVVFRLAGTEKCDPGRLRDHSARLRETGIRIDLRNIGAVLPDAAAVEAVQPDIATIDGTFLARLATAPEAKRLLDVLLGQFRLFGTAVQTDHLDSQDRLLAAFDTRADLLQGDRLAVPMLAGTAFPMEAVSVPVLARFGDTAAMAQA